FTSRPSRKDCQFVRAYFAFCGIVEVRMRQFLSGPVVKLPYSRIYQLRERLDLQDPTLLHPSSSSARVFDEIKEGGSSEWPRAHLDFSVGSITDDARVLHIYYGPCLTGLCRSRWPALASFFSS